jgi:DNA-binding response OmpR family regulator
MIERQSRQQPYQILVSDDDEGCREAVRDALESRGYRPHVASCGREAIDYVKRHFVHALIVDMNMPDLSGVETVHIIRTEARAAIPSILMSADSSPELKVRALSARFESFVPKPIDLRVLWRIVEEILRKYYEVDSRSQ